MTRTQDRRSPLRIFGWTLLVIPVVGVLAGIGTLVTVSVQNDRVAEGVERELRDLPLPDGAELVDSFSQVGRWAGGGNGTMYLGAILIRSDMPRAEIESFYLEQDKLGQESGAIHPSVATVDGASDSMAERTFREQFGELVAAPQYFVVRASAEAPSTLHYQWDLRGR